MWVFSMMVVFFSGGTGLLFFEFSRILRLLELTATPDQPLFWFFENVVFMGHQDKMTINRFLEVSGMSSPPPPFFTPNPFK